MTVVVSLNALSKRTIHTIIGEDDLNHYEREGDEFEKTRNPICAIFVFGAITELNSL